MRIDLLQHVPFEGPAAIAEWAQGRGHRLRATRLDQDQALPPAAEVEALIVMGGPMGVHDEEAYPWLAREKALIAEAVGSGRQVLGVCLGAQLIAHALGARVFRNPEKEIGWWPIEWTDARDTRASTVFHWHGDTFDLPPGAVRLAASAACANQAFALGERVLGLQFHLEVTAESVRALVQNCASDLAPAPFVQDTEDLLRDGSRYPVLHALLFEVLDRWMPSTG